MRAGQGLVRWQLCHCHLPSSGPLSMRQLQAADLSAVSTHRQLTEPAWAWALEVAAAWPPWLKACASKRRREVPPVESECQQVGQPGISCRWWLVPCRVEAGAGRRRTAAHRWQAHRLHPSMHTNQAWPPVHERGMPCHPPGRQRWRWPGTEPAGAPGQRARPPPWQSPRHWRWPPGGRQTRCGGQGRAGGRAVERHNQQHGRRREAAAHAAHICIGFVGKDKAGAATLLTSVQLPHCSAHQMGMVVPAWAAALATAVARPAAPPWAVAEAEAWANACRQRGELRVGPIMSASCCRR